MANFHVIIPAAGAGSRMQSGLPKQYLSLSGKPVIQHTLAVFAANPRISSITLVLNPEDAIWDNLVGKIATSKLRVERCGGDTRAATVLNGLEALQEVVDADDWVLVHDAARPGLSTLALERLLDTLKNDEVGGLLAIPLADTLKRADSEQRVASTESRDALWQAQTPQMFRYGLLKRALQRTGEAAPTDEAQAIERFGLQPKLVQGELRNLKITYQQDLALLQAIFNADASENGDGNNMRIGHGFDVHQLVAGRKCIIGGVDVPHEKGLQGHSDADVLLHAISDALLGAAGLGDIGKHFPDSEERYKGIDSRQLLRHVAAMLKEKQFLVVNIDATVIAEAPKLAPYITQMRANIAEDCGIPVDEVNVKATTTEKLGFTGRGEGIAAEAVCLIQRFHI